MNLLEIAQTRNSPFAAWLGIRFTEATPERLVAELTVREEQCTLPAIAHGGVLMAFADTMGATATVLNLRPGQGTTTLESKTNFFAPAPAGSTITAVTEPLHRGGRTQVWQTRISNTDGRLLVQVIQTQMVLEARS